VHTVLLTHRHPDHAEGLNRFLALTGARLAAADGDLRAAPDDFTVRAVPTPGHTADSRCFEVGYAGERAVFTGDTILGRGTTVIAWPDGDLGDYLDSLERLSAYQDIPALPGHGPALADCAAAARLYLAHRRARLDQVRAVVARGVTATTQIVDEVYGDVEPALRAAAEWSVRAQLAYLSRESGSVADGLDLP
jgi:glyoxylase-like metal-dependent hydrolase (beta-lactamase superfamily II)